MANIGKQIGKNVRIGSNQAKVNVYEAGRDAIQNQVKLMNKAFPNRFKAVYGDDKAWHIFDTVLGKTYTTLSGAKAAFQKLLKRDITSKMGLAHSAFVDEMIDYYGAVLIDDLK